MEYIAIENSSVEAADRLLDSFDHVLHLLAANPEMGSAYDHLHPGLRGFSVGKYVLFYLPLTDGITLLRVFHGARNFEDLFRDE